MPEPAQLRLLVSDGQALVSCGRFLVYRFEVGDLGTRKLGIVALTDADCRVDEGRGGVRVDRDASRALRRFVSRDGVQLIIRGWG